MNVGLQVFADLIELSAAPDSLKRRWRFKSVGPSSFGDSKSPVGDWLMTCWPSDGATSTSVCRLISPGMRSSGWTSQHSH